MTVFVIAFRSISSDEAALSSGHCNERQKIFAGQARIASNAPSRPFARRVSGALGGAACEDCLIRAYTQNRVTSRLSSFPFLSGFECDGIVEFEFEDESIMADAWKTAEVQYLLPEDEVGFLDGITLCRVEAEGV